MSPNAEWGGTLISSFRYAVQESDTQKKSDGYINLFHNLVFSAFRKGRKFSSVSVTDSPSLCPTTIRKSTKK
jgi:hypothetical protein